MSDTRGADGRAASEGQGEQRASERASTTRPAAWVRTGLGARWFAWLLACGERFDRDLYGDRKHNLLGRLEGTVVEIGPGAGANLPYYPAGIRWKGVEPNVYFHARLREKAAKLGVEAEVIGGVAERLDLPDASADAVVSTLVLCSVEDVQAVLAEVRRVLKPDGRLVFLEHVAAPPGSGLRRLQRFIRPAWAAIADGCRPDRETGRHIERAGFADVQIEPFDAAMPLPVVRPHIVGTARRR